MASGSTVSDEAEGASGGIGAGEKQKWTETKVYRRRTFKGVKSNGGVPSNPTVTATATATTIKDDGHTNQNRKRNLVEDGNQENNHFEEGSHTGIHIDGNGVIESEKVDGNGVIESEKVVPVPSYVEIPSENANLKQIQPETVVEVISDKLLSPLRTDSVVPISNDLPVINGASRPALSAFDFKFKITLASASKPYLKEMRRKFENELFSLRKVAKKMDDTGDEMAPEIVHPVVNNGLVVNGARSNGFATQVYSGTRSLGHVPYKPNIRPFNQLRISVVENGMAMADSMEREKRTPKANQLYRNSEFLLAKDKFPPAESNKKSKSNGKKSSRGEFGFGVGSKVYKSCSTLLEKLMKHKHGWVFNSPVDVMGLGLHDYFLIIKNPMDLGTVKTRLSKCWYKSPMEFAEDVRLTFHNAMLYNPKGQDVHIMAETLLKIFEDKWPDIEWRYLRELRMAVDYDLGLPTPTSRRMNPFLSPVLPPAGTRVFNRSESMPHPVNTKLRTLTPAPSFRTPALKKPKAKDVDKRDMTYDEKQKLSTNLQSLPPEKLEGIIQIIKKRSTALSQNDDEIEVDIDSVDTETLWELDRFVTNYKKNLSKNRRKAELANQMRAEARQAIVKTTIPQSVAPKETTAGNENANLSSPTRGNDPAAIASGSSSSSSSSSSGSSSSDTDSDSSSDESDAGQSPGT
uniref:Transcription factor GTE4-like n=1 Tax=Kalanchoe fedtschenkoi TaxID=63787 RepID=A0A7N0VKA1_KALFE